MSFQGSDLKEHTSVQGRRRDRRAALMMFLVVALTAGLGLAPHAVAAQPTNDDGEIIGIPWTGEPGITETVDQIMRRQKNAPALVPGVVKEAEKERGEAEELHDRPIRPTQNPLSPNVPATALQKVLVTDVDRALAPQPVGVAFETERLFVDAAFIPPDTIGDVGPTQILTMTNGRIKVFNKAGTVGPLNADLDVFFNSVRDGLGTTDPHVRYDRLSQRWFALSVNITATGTANKVLIAVSSGPTITGAASFTFFSFKMDLVGPTPNTDTNGFLDYPTLGVDKFALYIGGSIINSTFTAYVGATGFVVNKANLIGGTLTATAFRQMTNYSTTAGPYAPQGVSNDDPNATQGYFIGVDALAFGLVQIRRVSNPGGTPTLSGNLSITVPSTQYPVAQFQKGSSTTAWRLDPTDDRLFAAGIHRNKLTGVSNLWTAHNIGVDSTGTSSVAVADRNAARFYEIGNLTAVPTLVQSAGIFGGSGAASAVPGFIFPSVAISGQGHMAMGMTLGQFATDASTSGFYPSLGMNGRLRTDAPNTINGNIAIIAGTNRYSQVSGGRNRWGDFSQTWVDPTDDQTLWTFQEYCPARNVWATAAVQLKAPPPATPSSTSPSGVCQGLPSVSVTVTGTSASGSEFFDPGPDTGGPGYTNHIGTTVTGGVTVNSTAIVVPGSPSTTPVTQITLNLDTTGASPGAQNVTVTNPDGQNATGVGILTINATPSPPTASNNGAICQGGTLQLSASTVGGATYSWTGPAAFSSNQQNPQITNATPAASGTYTVTVTVAGCTSTGATTNATVTPNGGACDDGNGCTVNDACGGGACGGTTIIIPNEVSGLNVQSDKQTLIWNSASPAGPGTVHDVPRGLVSQLPVGSGGSEICLATTAAATTTDSTTPSSGNSYWYLVRGRNTCGTGSYGTDSSSNPRNTSVCP